MELGGQPDSVAVSPDGTFVAIAIENERNEDINDEKFHNFQGFCGNVNLADNSVTKADLVVFSTIAPNDPEPEFVDINNLGEIVVSIQENNWMAVIDRNGKVISEFDAGLVTLEGVDNKKDGELKMVDTIENVRREPDAVKWIDNDHFATANEGDYKHESTGSSKNVVVVVDGQSLIKMVRWYTSQVRHMKEHSLQQVTGQKNVQRKRCRTRVS